MEFEVSVWPSPERRLLEGSGELGDITVIMGRPRSGKSLFLRYLFALLSEDHELAVRTSEEVLDGGGWARLKVGDASLDCSKSQEDGASRCVIKPYLRKEAYLFYEGILLTLKYRLTSPESSKIINAVARLFERIAEFREGKWRYDVVYTPVTGWLERVDGKLIRFGFASAAVVAVGVLERAFLLDAWLLLDGTLDELFPEEVFYLAGRASSAKARLVVTTHSPWVRDAFRCHRGVAKAQGMPVGQSSVAVCEFIDGGVHEIELTSETYGDALERLYVVCE